MKRKIIGTLLFMFLAAAELSAFSKRDSFEGFTWQKCARETAEILQSL